jgi:ketosteroid isomerase-like protein
MSAETVEHPVLAVDRRRRAASVAADLVELEAIVDDDCVYVHSSGGAETKAELLDRIRTQDLLYHRIDATRTKVREFGDIVIVHGNAEIDVRASGVEREIRASFVQVWVNRNGTWRMTAWQSTPLPKP